MTEARHVVSSRTLPPKAGCRVRPLFAHGTAVTDTSPPIVSTSGPRANVSAMPARCDVPAVCERGAPGPSGTASGGTLGSWSGLA